MQILSFLLLALAPALTPAADWKSIIDRNGGSQVYFGVGIEGPKPYTRNYAESFAPASNSKLLTSGAVLEAFGKDHRYITRLKWSWKNETTATNVRLIGEGDPSWGMSQFGEGLRTRVNLISQALFDQGVRVIEGEVRVLAADLRLDEIHFPLGWKNTDPLGCGGAIGQSFNLNINCATLVITSATAYRWQETGVPTRVEMKVRAGNSTNISLKLTQFSPGQLGYTVEGTWKAGAAARSFYIPVWSVREWVRNLFLISLKEKGIRLESGRNRNFGEEAELEFPSLPLSELLKPFNKNSINVMGDSFLRTLALTEKMPFNQSILQLGLVKLKDYLLRIGVPDEFALYDGSGLSRISRITPAAMIVFLEKAKDKDFDALWGSLPIAGVDGTLRNRMKGTAAQGYLRAKTGTLNGVYALSGYVPEGNAFVPFVMLSQTTTAHASTAREAQNRVGATLSSLVRSTDAAIEEVVPFPYVPEHAGFDDQ